MSRASRPPRRLPRPPCVGARARAHRGGVFLGAHFALWVIGLQNTSLPRSLLLVCSTPLIISLGALACGFPVSLGELAGASLGVAGAAFLAADPSRDVSLGPAPSWAGDVVSFGAAAAIVPYMLVGHASREWMPLFMYACPVTLVAAIVTAAASLATESAGVFVGGGGVGAGVGVGARGALFGWLVDPEAFLVVAYLALVGMVGHTVQRGVTVHSTARRERVPDVRADGRGFWGGRWG